jgi:16S rRNA (adenine1518-N6/adenine1519-N6)-dimethyltransferase
VLEIGAGLGSLTVALASAGARVLAVEVDRSLLPPLEEAVSPFGNVRLAVADAMTADWVALLDGPGPWAVVANLPYNVAVPVVLRILDEEPRVERLLVMVQREVGERLAALPGEEQFGAVSLRLAYRAEARVLRRVPATVFWPRPAVESVLVQMVRRPPPVAADEPSLWTVVREAFGQRRKTVRSALVRLGFGPQEARDALARCGLQADSRAEELSLEGFACLARIWRVTAAGR